MKRLVADLIARKNVAVQSCRRLLAVVTLKVLSMFARTVPCLIALTFLAGNLLPPNSLRGQTSEPPRMMELRINGQSHKILAGQKLELDLTGKTSIELVELPNRLFGHGGVEFQYPARFVFAADISEEVAAWNLDTEIAGLVLHEIPVEEAVSAEEIAKEIVSDYGSEAEYGPREIKLGDTTIKGVEAVFTFEETVFSYEVYPIATTGGHRFLVLQDLLDEDGENSRDYHELRQAVTGSFRILKTEAVKYVK